MGQSYNFVVDYCEVVDSFERKRREVVRGLLSFLIYGSLKKSGCTGDNRYIKSNLVIDISCFSTERDEEFKSVKQSMFPGVSSDHAPLMLQCDENSSYPERTPTRKTITTKAYPVEVVSDGPMALGMDIHKELKDFAKF
ncbi:hypothetical protein H5410_057357 [Solanum commersonii]|uniref:Uncharacterized protein n=1 Tax=Solanum commersonii TaxID=4109 RepID=A0A9J5WPU6_SOLCO|nr:hypothetical protein H5410_057357 [Solanum commersonii]